MTTNCTVALFLFFSQTPNIAGWATNEKKERDYAQETKKSPPKTHACSLANKTLAALPATSHSPSSLPVISLCLSPRAMYSQRRTHTHVVCARGTKLLRVTNERRRTPPTHHTRSRTNAGCFARNLQCKHTSPSPLELSLSLCAMLPQINK